MLIIPGVLASSFPRVSGSFESIATATGTGSSATITFNSIPSTYQHLQIRLMAKTTDTSIGTLLYRLTFNGDNNANYARHALNGSGSSALATGNADVNWIDNRYATMPNSNAAIPNIMGVSIIDIHDYASTTKNKTVRAINGLDTNASVFGGTINVSSGLWRSTSAITSINLVMSDGANWTTNSTFALYGIKGA